MSSATPSPSPYEPAPAVYPVAPPRGRGCLVALAVLLGVGLAFSLLVNLVLVGGRASAVAQSGHHRTPLREKWVSGEGEPRICLIELSGVIMEEQKSEGLISTSSRLVDRIQRELDEVEKDEKVKAVLFSVDSPGGSVSASDQIWHALKKFKERSKKPLVVWMGGLAASGGYYVSMPADLIVCSPTTITGSIGVIMQTFNFADASQRFGVQNVTIKSGANKDLLNPFLPIREEHVRIIQSMIDDAYDLFVSRVVEGRSAAGLTEMVVRQLADGRIYTASQALKEKLVDRIGYRDDALEEAKKLAKVEGPVTLFHYTGPPGLIEVLVGEPEASAAGAALGRAAHGPDLSIEGILSLGTPRLMFLWSPTAR